LFDAMFRDIDDSPISVIHFKVLPFVWFDIIRSTFRYTISAGYRVLVYLNAINNKYSYMTYT